MSKRYDGYNNPAFTAHFDPNLYDYEYVPEIDPDSPEIKHPRSKKIRGGLQSERRELLQNKRDNSDDSNGSIIVEECNNRRVTLICEKRPVQDPDGGYYHDISLESVFDHEEDNPSNRRAVIRKAPPRQEVMKHRYEEISDDYKENNRPCHRYSEIDEFEIEGVHFGPKPPARPPKPKALSPINFNPNKICSSSPIDIFELSDLSPPSQPSRYQRAEESAFRTPIKRTETVQITPKSKSEPKSKKIRRNIFSDSPYKPTTQPLNTRTTAVITPIFQRKISQMTDFEKMSKRSQSTGNLRQEKFTQNTGIPVNFNREADLKRTKSISYIKGIKDDDAIRRMSPVRTFEAATSLVKSISPTKSNFDEDESPVFSTQCLFCSAVLQFLAGTAAVATAFFLISKLERHAFLDLAVIAGFVNIALGVLGFRPYYKRWLPSRHFVSGYITLAVFAMMGLGFLLHLLALHPIKTEPLYSALQVLSTTMSVIIIILACIGFLFSYCCKSIVRDNRVTIA